MNALIGIYLGKYMMASSGACCMCTQKLHSISSLFLSDTGKRVFWIYWHQYIVTIWVTRQPTDRGACSIYNTHIPLSSTLDGYTPHAGSKCRNCYLTMTHYVLQISYEYAIMFLCPTSGNDNILTSTYLPTYLPRLRACMHRDRARAQSHGQKLKPGFCSVLSEGYSPLHQTRIDAD